MIQGTRVGNIVVFTTDKEGRDDLTYAYMSGGYASVVQVVAENLHEQWEFIRPEEIGALTEADILAPADDIIRDDEGSLTSVSNMCWFPDYAIRDPWFDLAKTGRVEFPTAPE